MPAFTVPLHEFNDCHAPAGSPDGGQFCSKGGGNADNPVLKIRSKEAQSEAYVQRVRAIGRLNPFDEREVIVNNEAVVEVRPSWGTVYVTGLRAMEHKTGIGTRTMQTLVDLADEMGVTLTLNATPLPVPKGQKKIPKAKLVEFYKRFGFTGRASDMRREPRAA